MAKWIVAFISTSLLAVFASGQTRQCPRISVEGPGGVGEVGQPVPYTVLIQPSENLAALSYLWSVTTARGPLGMVKGQGTSTIEVPWNDDAITVSVRVLGLPRGCPDIASDSDPQYTRIQDGFPLDSYGPRSPDNEKPSLDNLASRVSGEPADEVGYIVLEYPRETREAVIKKRVKSVRDFLFRKRRLPRDRFFFLVKRSEREYTSLWLKPIGDPPCTECIAY